jgi:hypothetical protein
MNQHEIERIAAALHQARPDWPVQQLRTLLADKLADKPRRDVFVALAWVACESGTASPYRVLETGPWWKAAGVEGASTGGRRDWPDDGHRCRTCSQDRAGHDRLNANTPPDEDHPWETAVGDRRLPADQAHAVVGELRDHKSADPPPRPKPETSTHGTERVAQIRAEMDNAKEGA